MLKCTNYCQARKNGHIIFCQIGQTYDFADGDSYPKNCFRACGMSPCEVKIPRKRKKRKAEGE